MSADRDAELAALAHELRTAVARGEAGAFRRALVKSVVTGVMDSGEKRSAFLRRDVVRTLPELNEDFAADLAEFVRQDLLELDAIAWDAFRADQYEFARVLWSRIPPSRTSMDALRRAVDGGRGRGRAYAAIVLGLAHEDPGDVVPTLDALIESEDYLLGSRLSSAVSTSSAAIERIPTLTLLRIASIEMLAEEVGFALGLRATDARVRDGLREIVRGKVRTVVPALCRGLVRSGDSGVDFCIAEARPGGVDRIALLDALDSAAGAVPRDRRPKLALATSAYGESVRAIYMLTSWFEADGWYSPSCDRLLVQALASDATLLRRVALEHCATMDRAKSLGHGVIDQLIVLTASGIPRERALALQAIAPIPHAVRSVPFSSLLGAALASADESELVGVMGILERLPVGVLDVSVDWNRHLDHKAEVVRAAAAHAASHAAPAVLVSRLQQKVDDRARLEPYEILAITRVSDGRERAVDVLARASRLREDAAGLRLICEGLSSMGASCSVLLPILQRVAASSAEDNAEHHAWLLRGMRVWNCGDRALRRRITESMLDADSLTRSQYVEAMAGAT